MGERPSLSQILDEREESARSNPEPASRAKTLLQQLFTIGIYWGLTAILVLFWRADPSNPVFGLMTVLIWLLAMIETANLVDVFSPQNQTGPEEE